MNLLQRFDQLHQTKAGHALFGLIELGLGYWALLWALDSGSLLAWGFTIVLLLGSVQNIIMLTWKATRRHE